MPDSYKNFIITSVATAPSPATSGTSLVVSAGYGANLPTVPYNMTVWPAGSQPTASNAEIIRVTARSTDTLTIERAQEGSTARSIAVGDQIALTITAKAITDLMAKAVYDPYNNGYISGKNHPAAGYLNMDIDPDVISSSGNVWTKGGSGSASATGGSILTHGGTGTLAKGGHVLTYGTSLSGGNIETWGGGGHIITKQGGGGIDTRGKGVIELGGSGTRTFIRGTATANREQRTPDKDGTYAMTSDSFVKAMVDFNASSITGSPTGTYSRTSPSTTITITETNHGRRVGHYVYLDFTTGAATDGAFVITSVIDADHYTITSGAATTTSGNVTMYQRPMAMSENVHSVVVTTAVGLNYINFTTPMANATYVGTVNCFTVNTAIGWGYVGLHSPPGRTVDACSITTYNNASALTAFGNTMVTIINNQ